MMQPFLLEDDTFFCQHLLASKTDVADIQQFRIAKATGQGLERYLKNVSASEEEDNFARTYLVRNKRTREIASFFTLKMGLFTIRLDEEYFYTVPAVELANFAVNSAYREAHPEVSLLGKNTFHSFVLPLVDYARSFVGAKALYIYALPQDRLIQHYMEMGFERLGEDEEQFVHEHIKPKYDDGCIFMYQMLE